MPPKTRASKTKTPKTTAKNAAEAIAASSTTDQKVPLEPESPNPPKLFILPKDTSPEARIMLLPNPRTSIASRYYHCPEKGFYEFTKIAAPKTTPRSWLLTGFDSSKGEYGKDGEAGEKRTGYVTKAADLFVATPIDELFLVLPVLAPAKSEKQQHDDGSKRGLFLEADDYLDKLSAESKHYQRILREQSNRKKMERRIAVVCDTVEAGDETMYRLSEKKLVQELVAKAKRMVKNGLPASMEEKLVRKALEPPVLGIKRTDTAASGLEEDEEVSQSSTAPTTQRTESQSTTSTGMSEASTAATSISESAEANTAEESNPLPPVIVAPEGVPELLRLRTAVFFLCSNYMPSHLADTVKKTLLSSESPIDFAPLDSHLAHLNKLRQEALASRSLGDFSRKRSMNEDDEGAETRAEKKRKKDEEEKRKKAGESRGVRELKKVNVSGMKKMSDFFKKKV